MAEESSQGSLTHRPTSPARSSDTFRIREEPSRRGLEIPAIRTARAGAASIGGEGGVRTPPQPIDLRAALDTKLFAAA
jgi:hypothetical protein